MIFCVLVLLLTRVIKGCLTPCQDNCYFCVKYERLTPCAFCLQCEEGFFWNGTECSRKQVLFPKPIRKVFMLSSNETFTKRAKDNKLDIWTFLQISQEMTNNEGKIDEVIMEILFLGRQPFVIAGYASHREQQLILGQNSNTSFELKPLFCDEIMIYFSNEIIEKIGDDLRTNCYLKNEQAIILLKRERLYFFTRQSFTMRNIKVDGRDLAVLQRESFEYKCLQSTYFCCELYYDPEFQELSIRKNSSLEESPMCSFGNSPAQDLFMFEQNNVQDVATPFGFLNLLRRDNLTSIGPVPPQCNLINVNFENFIFTSTRSLIKLNDVHNSLLFSNVTIINSFFLDGTISYNSLYAYREKVTTLKDSLLKWSEFNNSNPKTFDLFKNNFVFLDTKFYNYNPANLAESKERTSFQANVIRPDGMLINLLYYGILAKANLTILRSDFKNSLGSVIIHCSQADDHNRKYYIYNLDDEQGSAPPLGSEAQNISSSLISLFYTLPLINLEIRDTQFTGLKGFSGTVLNLIFQPDLFTGNGITYIISNTSFKNNFALTTAPNINVIIKMRMLNKEEGLGVPDASLTIENSNFTQSSVCFSGFINSFFFQETPIFVRVSLVNCVFKNNSARVTNGFLFHNIFILELIDCFFSSNRVGDYGTDFFYQNSSFYKARFQYKSLVFQSSSLFVSQIINITLIRCQFLNNTSLRDFLIEKSLEYAKHRKDKILTIIGVDFHINGMNLENDIYRNEIKIFKSVFSNRENFKELRGENNFEAKWDTSYYLKLKSYLNFYPGISFIQDVNNIQSIALFVTYNKNLSFAFENCEISHYFCLNPTIRSCFFVIEGTLFTLFSRELKYFNIFFKESSFNNILLWQAEKILGYSTFIYMKYNDAIFENCLVYKNLGQNGSNLVLLEMMSSSINITKMTARENTRMTLVSILDSLFIITNSEFTDISFDLPRKYFIEIRKSRYLDSSSTSLIAFLKLARLHNTNPIFVQILHQDAIQEGFLLIQNITLEDSDFFSNTIVHFSFHKRDYYPKRNLKICTIKNMSVFGVVLNNSNLLKASNFQPILIQDITFRGLLLFNFSCFVYASSSEFMLKNITIHNNKGVNSSFALLFISRLTFNDSIIKSNYFVGQNSIQIDISHVALFFIYDSSYASLTNITFHNVTKKFFFYLKFSELIMNKIKLQDCSFHLFGLVNEECYFDIRNSEFNVFKFSTFIKSIRSSIIIFDSFFFLDRLKKITPDDIFVTPIGSFIKIHQCDDSHDIHFNNSVFLNLETEENGAININSVVNPNKVIISNNKFFFNRAKNNGGALFISNCFTVNISDNYFKSNKAANGGALYLLEVYDNFILMRNKFIANTCQDFAGNKEKDGRGGAIFYQITNQYGSFYSQVHLNIFYSNKAYVGGAIFWVYWPIFPFDIEYYKYSLNFSKIYEESFFKNHFTNNSASAYGLDIASPLFQLVFFKINIQIHSGINKYINEPLLLDNYQQITYSNVNSGYPFEKELYILALDYYQQIGVVNQGVITKLISAEEEKFLVASSKGFFSLYTTTFKQRPGSLATYKIETNLFNFWQSFKKNPFTIRPEYPELILNISFRNCIRGERMTDDGKCERCPRDSYAFTNNFTANTIESSTCLSCDKEKFYCHGGDWLTPHPGYWRFSSDSLKFLPCPNQQACLGSNDFILNPNGECMTGYKGILCATCDKNFAMDDSFLCRDCFGDYSFYFTNLIIYGYKSSMVLYCLYLYLLTLKNYKESEQQHKENLFKKFTLMKMFINHQQMLTITMNTIRYYWKDGLFFFLYKFNDVLSPSLVNFQLKECLLILFGWQISSFFSRILFIILFPTLGVVVLYIFWAIRFKMKNKILQGNVKFMIKFVACFKFLMYNFQFSFVILLMEVFDCVNVNDDRFPGSYYLNSDYTIDCNSQSYRIFVSGLFFPFLIILGVMIPIVEYAMLVKHLRLNRYYGSIYNQSKFAYLAIGFTRTKMTWEFIIYLRKVILIITSINFWNKLTKGLILQFVLMVALYLQTFRRPYQEESYNSLERKSIFTSTLLINVWLYYSEETKLNDSKNMFAFMLAVLFQSYFYLSWIAEFAKFSSKFNAIRTKILKSETPLGKFYSMINIFGRSGDRKSTLRRFLEKLAKRKLN